MPHSRYMVVIDPTQKANPALDRALQLAERTGAAIHLYSCTCRPPNRQDGESAGQALMRFRDGVIDDMKALSARAESLGLDSSMELNCAQDWRPEMISAAARCGANMVVKFTAAVDSPRGRSGSGDWTLMRLAPCPVLFVRRAEPWAGANILAAVRPGELDDEHLRLNGQLVNALQRFSRNLDCEAHVVVVGAADVNEVARLCGVDPGRVHQRSGGVEVAIREVALGLGSDLVLVGTVARGGLMGEALGNTAERLLDKLPCDLMVIS